MAAGAATAVVGWWTGYKLGGIIALETATAFQNAGVEDYWQATFLVLGVVVIVTNIGLLFVHEQGTAERIASQAEEEGPDCLAGWACPAPWATSPRGSAARW